MTKPITDRPLRARGRKPKQPPAAAAQRITALAADGFSVVGIARGLHTSPDTLRRWLDEVPALREAFEAGRESERHALHNLLFKQATENGNVIAAFFLLKTRHNYCEAHQKMPQAIPPEESAAKIREYLMAIEDKTVCAPIR